MSGTKIRAHCSFSNGYAKQLVNSIDKIMLSGEGSRVSKEALVRIIDLLASSPNDIFFA